MQNSHNYLGPYSLDNSGPRLRLQRMGHRHRILEAVRYGHHSEAIPLKCERSGMRVIGIPWYTPEAYALRLNGMSDSENVASDYASWLNYAEDVAERITSAGVAAFKVVIVPKDFQMWCQAKWINPDAPALYAFAAAVAAATAS